jgi:asparagine synthase (glutamine-hydrolysing)
MARTLLSENGGQPLPTFSAIFDEVTQCDERPFINKVLAQGDIEPHYVHGDRLSPLTDLDRVLWHQDEPLYSFNLFLNWSLYSLAKQQNVRVLLEGFDGDTTVSHGVGYLHELARAGHWIDLSTEVKGYARTFNCSPWRMLWSYAWHYGLDPIISQSKVLRLIRRIWLVLLRRSLHRHNPSVSRPVWSATLNPDFVQRISLVERRQLLRKDRSVQPQTEREYHYRTLTWGVMPYTLEVLDRAAAAFSIELRFPFWDKRLAEFCLALPPEQKIYRGWTRMVMRRAMTGILPVDVQWRRNKSNLAPNFDHGLLAFERERLDEVMLKNPESIEEFVDVAALREAHCRFVSQQATKDEDVDSLWKAMSLSLWLQRTGLTP